MIAARTSREFREITQVSNFFIELTARTDGASTIENLLAIRTHTEYDLEVEIQK
jgi:hypothetical protein